MKLLQLTRVGKAIVVVAIVVVKTRHINVDARFFNVVVAIFLPAIYDFYT
jgi:hypothetical protein